MDIVIEQWDQMLRVAASLKKRLTPAHVIKGIRDIHVQIHAKTLL